LPDGFLHARTADMHRVLPGPTLIHLSGRRPEPLFVSVLLHGNEDTGLKAVQSVLAAYRDRELPRALSLFVGNVQAAAKGQRHLPNQPDYNRVWPGADSAGLPEHAMTRSVVDQMRARGVFASLDIHNNTGINPHYGCVNRLEAPFLHLAALFSRIVVYFKRPLGVQSAAFSQLCPSVTVECGKPGSAESEAHAAAFLEAALHLAHFPAQAVVSQDLALYHTVATVKVQDQARFTFLGGADAQLWFEPALDHLNFHDLPAGTRFARVAAGSPQPLVVTDEDGREVTHDYFEIRDGELRTRRVVMPSMLTLNEEVIRQDCLCYLMERLPYKN
jgi:succinylglutamate desuccinylase